MRRFLKFTFLLISTYLIIPSVNGYSSSTDTSFVIRVLCYNIRFGELASLEQLADFIKSQNPDVVALQEVDYKTHRSLAPHQNGKDFITELGYRTGMFCAYGKTIPYSGGYYGVGILSRHPLAETKRIYLPSPAEQRALLTATVEMPDSNFFTFACTHLDVSSSKGRQDQVKAINRALNNNPYPIILAGDFNAQPTSTEIKEGMAQWLRACTPDFTIPVKEPKSKIDYIFYYPQKSWKVLSAKTYSGVTLSDHLPLGAEMELVLQK